MAAENLVRTGGGIVSAAAGPLLLVSHLLDLGGDTEYGTVLGGILVLAAHVALVFALVALYAAQAERSGLLGSLGMVLGVVGTTLVSGVVLVEIAGASGAAVDVVLATGLPSALAVLGGWAFLIGLIVFGIATMRAGVLPRWAGLLLIVGDVVFGAASFAGAARAREVGEPFSRVGVDQGRQPGSSVPLGTVRLGYFGLLGLQDRKRDDREDRPRHRRSAGGRGCVGHFRVSSGTGAAARAPGLRPSGADLRVVRSRSGGHRPPKPGPGVRGNRPHQRPPDVRVGALASESLTRERTSRRYAADQGSASTTRISSVWLTIKDT
jgi:hypothetical protein